MTMVDILHTKVTDYILKFNSFTYSIFEYLNAHVLFTMSM